MKSPKTLTNWASQKRAKRRLGEDRPEAGLVGRHPGEAMTAALPGPGYSWRRSLAPLEVEQRASRGVTLPGSGSRHHDSRSSSRRTTSICASSCSAARPSRRRCQLAIQKPGLALTGFTEHLHPERVQVFGNTEITTCATLTDERAARGAAQALRARPACVVVTKDLDGARSRSKREACERRMALMATPLLSSTFIQQVQAFLEEALTGVHQPPRRAHGRLRRGRSCSWARAASARARSRWTW